MKPSRIPGVRWIRPAAACCLLVFYDSSAGEDYHVDWFAIEGGGGESSGGEYSLSGAVSQPESGGSMSGSDFSVDAGFLSVITVEGPPLRIALSADATITVAWQSSFTTHPLQQSSDLTPESWEDSAYPIADDGITKSITFTAAPGKLFFRLIK